MRWRKSWRRLGAKALLDDVWRLDEIQSWGRDAYANHCNIHIAQTQATLQDVIDDSTTTELVALVKAKRELSITEILNAIKETSSKWSQSSWNDATAHTALDLVLKLWLFSGSALEGLIRQNSDKSLRDVSKQVHPEIHWKACRLLADSSLSSLSYDFSAKSLTRKGGFHIVWTSDISEHLKFVPNSKTQLQVFRHAQALKLYQEDRLTNEMFPVAFLEETYRTINVLFPFEDSKESRRIRRLQKRYRVDIEAASLEHVMDEHAKYQLDAYKFYSGRLAEIQLRYDSAKPRQLKQWWFDRRRRNEWATLMVALIVFILTVVFGIIQSITGVLQVLIAREARNS